MRIKQARRVRNSLRVAGFEVVRRSRSSSLLASHLTYLFPHHGVNCVLDVGARQGEYGRWLRDTGYQGIIASFEPVESNLQELQAVAADDDRWHVYPLALGSVDSTSTINVSNATHFSSFRGLTELAADKFGEESRVVGSQDVAVRRLDGMFDQVVAEMANPRVYLKMDTQGWDLEVLRGAEQVLPRIIALQSEVSFQPLYLGMPSFDEAWSTLQGYGYSMSGLFPVTVDADLKLIEADCVAVRSAQSG